MTNRKLPIGIQSFEKIRNGNYLYVDKTELVYRLAVSEIPYFLSRPRRFGKSLLISTLDAYFQGRKEQAERRAFAPWQTRLRLHGELFGDWNTIGLLIRCCILI